MNFTIDATVTQLVTALAALVAVIVGPWVSYKIARQQVVSVGRKEWNHQLRDALGEFSALLYQLGMSHPPRFMVILDAPTPEQVQLADLIRQKQIVELLLNPDESLHQELIDAMTQGHNAAFKFRRAKSESSPDLPKIRDEADLATEEVKRAGRAVLKAEWEKVKKGK